MKNRILPLLTAVIILYFTACGGADERNMITDAASDSTSAVSVSETFGTEPESTIESAPAVDSVRDDTNAEPAAADSAKENTAPEEKTATISFAGDCTFASYYGADYVNTFEKNYEENGEDYFFHNVVDIFREDDLTVVNLEGTFTTSTERVVKTFNFKSNPHYVGILHAGDIECVNVANNHTHDYSESGYQETIKTLDNAGIDWFAEEDTCLREVNGILFGFSGIYECESGLGCQDQAVENVKKLREAGAQVVICEFHWGDELSHRPNSNATTLAHAVVDAGADLVIGHHPHVLQGIEVYKGKYICYSLGNFCFGGTPGGQDKDSLIVQVTFTLRDDALAPMECRLIPCSFSSESSRNTYCPTPQLGEDGKTVLQHIAKYSGYLDGGLTESQVMGAADGIEDDSFGTDHDHIS